MTYNPIKHTTINKNLPFHFLNITMLSYNRVRELKKKINKPYKYLFKNHHANDPRFDKWMKYLSWLNKRRKNIGFYIHIFWKVRFPLKVNAEHIIDNPFFFIKYYQNLQYKKYSKCFMHLFISVIFFLENKSL